jgi:hypothetical protein
MSVLLALNEAISVNYEVDFAKINLIKNRVFFRKSESRLIKNGDRFAMQSRLLGEKK